MVCLLGIPAMLGLIVLAKPMLMVLFMRGEYTALDVDNTSLSLIAYACGLLNFMLIKVLAPGYYSRQDTKTPVKFGIIAMVVNMVFNAIFAWFYGYIGLAIATSLSAFVNMALLYNGLQKQNVYCVSKKTVVFFCKLVIAAGLMSFAIYYLLDDNSVWLTWRWFERLKHLFMLIGFGAVVYIISLLLMGVRLNDLKSATE